MTSIGAVDSFDFIFVYPQILEAMFHCFGVRFAVAVSLSESFDLLPKGN